jgi:hypothetical protein
MGERKRMDRMFWSSQSCSVTSMAAIFTAQHLTVDLLAAGGASLTIVVFGIVFVTRKPNHVDRSARFTIAGFNEDHMFWTAQAAAWATLAALAHVVALMVMSHILVSVVLVTLAVAMLNQKEEQRMDEEEIMNLVDGEIKKILREQEEEDQRGKSEEHRAG